MLCSDRVLACWDPERETMLWVDDGPDGLGATLTQRYQVEGMDHPSWRPVNYTSRAKTPREELPQGGWGVTGDLVWDSLQ